MHDKPRENCGLCAVSGGADVFERVHLGLHTLQHRGQEAAGIMVAFQDGTCRLHKSPGLVGQVFSTIPDSWPLPEIRRAISHVRYGTAGGSTAMNAQPLMVNIAGHTVGVAHNGTICNAYSLREELLHEGAIFQTSTDTELILHLMARAAKDCNGDLWKALEEALRRLKGAFSLLFMIDDIFAAARDPFGFRPLAIGDFDDGGYMVASETIAFAVAGAS